jgi:hypothetical protein
MTSRIKHISVLQLGIVFAVLYGLFGLIIGVIGALAFTAMPRTGTMSIASLGFSFILIAPIGYGVIGFLAGLLYAFFYNLVAAWTGGVELRLESVSVSVDSAM